jgi:hypothetical protein
MTVPQKNLDAFERIVRAMLGAFALFAAAALFVNPLARILSAAFGVFAFWECAAGYCPLHAKLGLRKQGDLLAPDVLRLVGLLGIQTVLAYEWFTAGLGKLMNAEFIVGMPKTLGTFASKNPYPAYKEFLLGPALRNAQAFGYAVEWSQVLVGIALAATVAAMLYVKRVAQLRAALATAVLALAAGACMNANFYLAAGWTGAGTKSVNIVMFWVQAILVYVWLHSLRALREPSAAPRA